MPAQNAKPSDPRAWLAGRFSSYNFADPALKPWHLKATYQLYDPQEKLAQTGSYELWWVSAKTYRESWSTPESSLSEWCAESGCAYKSTGTEPGDLERSLHDAFLNALPDYSGTDPKKYNFEHRSVRSGGAEFPCAMVSPWMPIYARKYSVPFGIFPAYCFDPKSPVLRMSYPTPKHSVEFSKIVRVQGKFLARNVAFYEGDRKLMTASVDAIGGLSPQDPALKAAPDAHPTGKVKIDFETASKLQLEKKMPTYPEDAKAAGIDGSVLLSVTIGRDGRLHNPRVLYTPWPSLAVSVLQCLPDWKYKPYEVDGHPTVAEATIKITFTSTGESSESMSDLFGNDQ